MSKTLILDNESTQRSQHLANIFRLRYQVFCEEKAWVSPESSGLDTDIYDTNETIHFAHINDSGLVDGCCRLVPTTRPNMLGDIFLDLLAGEPAPNHPKVWEISRFAIDTRNLDVSFGSVSAITSELLISLFRYAISNNIQQIVAVTDTSFERVLRRAGLYTTRFAPPRQYHNCEAVAGYAYVSEDIIEALEKRLEHNSQRLFQEYERQEKRIGNIDLMPGQEIASSPSHGAQRGYGE